MPFLIQAEERDVPYELFEQLANIIDESPVLTYADATSELHHGHGTLHFDDRAEAERVLGRFNGIGFRCFLLDKLLDVPPPETIHLPGAKLEALPELVAAARLDTVTEKKEWDFRPLGMRLSMFGNIPLTSGIEERTVEQSDSSFCLDLLTRAKHWRARCGYWAPIRDYLVGADLTAAYRNTAAKKLIANDRNIIHFESEMEFDHYVTWLYQMRYGQP